MKIVTCWICGREAEGPGDGTCEGKCGRPVCWDHIVGHECFMVCSVCALKEAVDGLTGFLTPEAKAEVTALIMKLEEKVK